MMNRTIAIGDIHGDSRSLQKLLEKIDPQPGDHLVFCGDVIDRGLDTKGVIETLIELSRRTTVTLITGNHEENCLEAHEQDASQSGWLDIGGQATLDSYESGVMPQEHLTWLRSGVDYLETDSFIFLHANFKNGCRLENTPARILRWEFLNDNPDNIPRHWSGKTVVVGHTVQIKGVLDLGHLVAIDTGAGFDGGWLTAFDTTNGIFHAANERGEYQFYKRL